MTIGWLLYSLAAGTAAGIAARGAEIVLRAAGLATRGVWLGAIVLTVVMSAEALRPDGRPAVQGGPAEVGGSRGAVPPSGPTHGRTPPVAEGSVARGGSVDVPGAWTRLRTATALALRTPLPRALGTAGALASVTMLLILGAGGIVTGIRRRRWPVVPLHGLEVHLSARVGPAVTGVLKPRIVVPRRLLAMAEREARAILAHEDEHRRAGDLRLLAVALLLLSAMPWNPVLWWHVGRLRLALEADCDRRTLRRLGDMTAVDYGHLLLAEARLAARPGLLAAALGHPARSLEARIRCLTRRGGLRRAAVGGLVTALALAAACEVPQPLGPTTRTDSAEGAEAVRWMRGRLHVTMPEDLQGVARRHWSGDGSGVVALRVSPRADGSVRTVALDAASEEATVGMVFAAEAVARALRVTTVASREPGDAEAGRGGSEGSSGGAAADDTGSRVRAEEAAGDDPTRETGEPRWVPVWLVFDRLAVTATVVDDALYDREGLHDGEAGRTRLLELMETYRTLRGGWNGWRVSFTDREPDLLLRGSDAAVLRPGGARGDGIGLEGGPVVSPVVFR